MGSVLCEFETPRMFLEVQSDLTQDQADRLGELSRSKHILLKNPGVQALFNNDESLRDMVVGATVPYGLLLNDSQLVEQDLKKGVMAFDQVSQLLTDPNSREAFCALSGGLEQILAEITGTNL